MVTERSMTMQLPLTIKWQCARDAACFIILLCLTQTILLVSTPSHPYEKKAGKESSKKISRKNSSLT